MTTLTKSSLGRQFKNILDARDNGVHKSFMEHMRFPEGHPAGGVDVEFGKFHEKSGDLKKKLLEFVGSNGVKNLMDFQISAIANMVYRPLEVDVTKTVTGSSWQGLSSGGVTEKGCIKTPEGEDDIGMMVINDLFTGSGKTLTSVMGAVLFASSRSDEIKKRVDRLKREQSSGVWNTRVEMSRSSESSMWTTPAFSNVIVIMCAKHLIGQWTKACDSTCKGLDKKIDVLVNPMPDFPATDDLRIFIVDSSPKMERLGLKFVPVVIVDEFVLKSPFNILSKPGDFMPLHGRLILTSADAGNIKNIVHGVSRKSFLRRMIGYDGRSTGMDFMDAMSFGIPLASASVLDTVSRVNAKKFMIDQLDKSPYEEYVVKYTPSFSSRLFGGNFEMSAQTGKDVLFGRFGIVLEKTNTIGDIIAAVEAKITTTERRDRKLRDLETFLRKLETFMGDTDSCPICLEDHSLGSGASLINPCWHVVCNSCMKTMLEKNLHKCPMCRTGIEGHATAVVNPELSENSVVQEVPEVKSLDPQKSLEENMNTIITPNMGLDDVCIDVLRCLQVDTSGECYKVIMVVPDDHFFTRVCTGIEEKLESSAVSIVQFKTSGTKRKRVTLNCLESQLSTFNGDQSPGMKILFTTEGKTDSLTGLDFPSVDCILSVGTGNTMQRLGRLTRLPRVLEEGSVGSTVRSICLVSN